MDSAREDDHGKNVGGGYAPLVRHRPRPSNNAGLLDRGQPDMDWSAPQLQARERGREREGIALAGSFGFSYGQVTANGQAVALE